jgi:hypothetical protein
MSWFKRAVEYGAGFIEGYVQGRVEQSNRQPGFAEHMAYLGRETRYPAVNIDRNAATFSAPVGGAAYAVVVVVMGDFVSINVASGIAFPRNQIPRNVRRFLMDQNRELPRCDFDILEAHDGDKFFLKCKVRAEALTPPAFEAAVGELLPLMVAVDRWLLEQGYAQ